MFYFNHTSPHVKDFKLKDWIKNADDFHHPHF